MESMSSRDVARPLYVSLGLWGVPSRAAALVWMWSCVAVAVLGIVLGFFKPVFFLGASLLISAAWYRAAIGWMDRNRAWPRS